MNRSLDSFLREHDACAVMRRKYNGLAYAQAWRTVLRDRSSYVWLAARLNLTPKCQMDLLPDQECPGCSFADSDLKAVKRAVPPRKVLAALSPRVRAAIRRGRR